MLCQVKNLAVGQVGCSGKRGRGFKLHLPAAHQLTLLCSEERELQARQADLVEWLRPETAE
jgi:hypothetical protein